MTYTVSSDKLRGTFTFKTITEARKKGYQMLSEHPRSSAIVYVQDKGIKYLSWTVMHCGKRFITTSTHIDDHRIVRKDGTLGIRIKAQRVRDGKWIIGYRYYADEEPKSGVVVDGYGKIVRKR